MASVDAENVTRDNHVRSEEFFDVANHPGMTYKVTGLNLTDGEGTVSGELTLRGVTKPVELDTEFNGAAVDALGVTRAGFTSSTSIPARSSTLPGTLFSRPAV